MNYPPSTIAYLDLIHDLLAVLLLVLLHEDLLDDEQRRVRLAPHQDHAALRAATQRAHLFELLVHRVSLVSRVVWPAHPRLTGV
jgi:hypothetical protein